MLRSGGVVAPIEFDLHSPRSLPATPLVGQALSWLREAFTPAGVDPALGPGLWAVLQAVGLQPPGRIGVQAHFGPEDPDGAAILARIVRTVLPLIERRAWQPQRRSARTPSSNAYPANWPPPRPFSLIQC